MCAVPYTVQLTKPQLEQTIKSHTKFVQDVRYAPTGDHFASVGSDGKLFLYDGKEGTTLGEFSGGHSGTVYAVSWSPDSKAISSCSADTTVKLWDVETRKATTTYTLGTGLQHQQVGNVWSSPDIIVSLSRSGEKPVKVLYGPQKAVTSAIPTSTASAGVTFLRSSGNATPLTGQGHTNLVSGLTSTPDGRVFSTGYDDRVREVEGGGFTASVFSTGSQPKSLAATSDHTIFVVEADVVEAVRNNQKVADLRPGGSSVVAIGFGDQKIRLYKWDGKAFQEEGLLQSNQGLVSALAFSPDGSKLAAGDSAGKVILYDVPKRELITTRWSFHSARVNTLSWTADSLHCASGALDTHIYVWSVKKPMKNIAIKNSIPGGVNAGRLVGMGADASVKVWQVKFHG
ncbi:WD40-repeat-containing domain protein [Lactifluus volemus]|nr:WD40-repeat-containing domain protein [Lactifluus volemus]